MTDLSDMYEIRDEDRRRRRAGEPRLIRSSAYSLVNDGYHAAKNGVSRMKWALKRGMETKEMALALRSHIERLESLLEEIHAAEYTCGFTLDSARNSIDLLSSFEKRREELD